MICTILNQISGSVRLDRRLVRPAHLGTQADECVSLPQAAHAVHVEECFIRDEHKVARQGLCDQHSVEGFPRTHAFVAGMI